MCEPMSACHAKKLSIENNALVAQREQTRVVAMITENIQHEVTKGQCCAYFDLEYTTLTGQQLEPSLERFRQLGYQVTDEKTYYKFCWEDAE